MSGEQKECVTLWLRIYLLTRDPWALSLFSLVQQLAMLRVVAAPSPLVPNGYNEQISLPPLWTYSIRNKSLCFRHWDFGGICYCSITSPTLINTCYEGNVPKWGMQGPACSQTQHPSSFRSWVSCMALNPVSGSDNRLCLCSWDQIHTLKLVLFGGALSCVCD